jgi:uncharacterized protein DUF1579
MPKSPEEGISSVPTSETNTQESVHQGRREFIKTAAMTAAGIAAATTLTENSAAAALTSPAEAEAAAPVLPPIKMRQQTVTPNHKALHAFQGNWAVSQKQWRGPNDSNPTVNTGTSVATIILNGLGLHMETTMSNGWHGIAIQTFNPMVGRFELAFLDTLSDQGVITMVGGPTPLPSRAGLRAEFGEAAQQVRTWNTAVIPHTTCVPGSGSSTTGMIPTRMVRDPKLVPVSTRATVKPPQTEAHIPLRLVENQVSPNQWVLEFFVTLPDGTEFMTQQNVFHRA